MDNYQSIKILNKDFKDYPLLEPLIHIHDSPKELYLKAIDQDVLNIFLNKKDENGRNFKVLTIVGSRKNTFYGMDCAEFLIKKLKDYPVIVVSGLALGIDTISHENALKNNLKTISVPGSGLGRKYIYPAKNVSLADRIIDSKNLLISEWKDDTKSELYFFPKRNRVMAAISDAVLIVEAGKKSGTLITARLAMEYGKNVGVIPNNIFEENSLGSNELIKDGATPINNISDLLEILNLEEVSENTEIDFENLSLSERERIIINLIKEKYSISKDELISHLENNNIMNYTEIIIILMKLEIDNLIKEEYGEIKIKR